MLKSKLLCSPFTWRLCVNSMSLRKSCPIEMNRSISFDSFDINQHFSAARFQTRHQSLPNPFTLPVTIADKDFSAHNWLIKNRLRQFQVQALVWPIPAKAGVHLNWLAPSASNP